MNIEHSCGKVLDYCQYEDTKIFFCIFCKKVTGAAKESQITMSMSINIQDFTGDMNEYSEETLKENV
jgi:hypothetical protein